MADYSKAKISLTLFQQEEEDRKTNSYPNQTGYFEITLADLDEFYQLAKSIEPELNYKNEPAVKLKIATWDKVGKDSGRKYQSCSVEPKPQTRFKQTVREQLVTAPQAEPAYVFNDDALI